MLNSDCVVLYSATSSSNLSSAEAADKSPRAANCFIRGFQTLSAQGVVPAAVTAWMLHLAREHVIRPKRSSRNEPIAGLASQCDGPYRESAIPSM